MLHNATGLACGLRSQPLSKKKRLRQIEVEIWAKDLNHCIVS